MSKTDLMERLKDDTYVKPKYQVRREARSMGKVFMIQEAEKEREERDKKINALKKKLAEKIKEHQFLYNRHKKSLHEFEQMGLSSNEVDNWASGRYVGILETLKELVKDLSEV